VHRGPLDDREKAGQAGRAAPRALGYAVCNDGGGHRRNLARARKELPMLSRIFVVLGIAVSTSLAFACSSTVDTECVAGAACTCADCAKTCGGDGKQCSFACTGGNCSFSCPGGGCSVSSTNATSVTLDCPGGGCSLTSRGTGQSAVACAGNGCQHTCSGAQSCKTTGCTTGCQTTCGGAATCESSCTPLNGGCTVDGAGASTTPTTPATPSPSGSTPNVPNVPGVPGED
jgi:hypothetical protein